MTDTHYISSSIIDLEDIQDIIRKNKKLALSEEASANISRARKYLDNKMKESETPVYVKNTGFV